jgi:hypothetical protein
VEVDARLGPHVLRERVVEEVHQHRLAAAHVAEQVEPPREVAGDRADGGLVVAATKPREEGLVGLGGVEGRVDDGRRVVVPQLLVEVLQALDDPLRGLVSGCFPSKSWLRLTSLMLIVSKQAARDSPVILLYWSDVLGVGYGLRSVVFLKL